jgi:type IV pilus assembly protein PilB
MSLLDALADKGLINRYQIDDILERSEKYNGDVDRALVDVGIDEGTLLGVKSELYDMPKQTVNTQSISFDVLKYIPEDSARYYKFVPIGVNEGGVLQVGMTDPGDIEARNALQFISSKNNVQYDVFLISRTDFESVLEMYKGLGAETSAAIDDLEENVLDVDESLINQKDPTGTIPQKGAEKKIVEDAPVTKMMAVILRHAVEGRASDVHIEHTGDKVKVRFRVDGTLFTSLVLPKHVHSALIARVKILAKLKLDEKRKPQDGRFHARIDNRKVDFRVSTLPTYHGEKAVIRILDPEKGIKSLEETGMREDQVKMIEEVLQRPYGLILVTGPTGSGKTTSLYSMLNKIDREKRNVVSLEDPIEYNVSGMNQSQVRPEIGYDFANGLRSILRQDPDVIMVGEIRDKETAQLAIQAALTGHLVFATLHTNNSIGVVPRLVDMGVDPYLIAPTLLLAMAQRLVKTLCPGTGLPKPVDGSIKQIFDKEFEDLPEQYRNVIPAMENVYEPEKSDTCPSGVKGRMAVFEMFRVDDDIERAILNDPTENTIYEIARKNGMVTMKEDAIIKALEQKIPFYEVNGL